MRYTATLAALLLFVGCAIRQTPPLTATTEALVLKNANVIDGVGGTPLLNYTVTIRGGRIVSVSADEIVPADATVIDLEGRWLLPGLIDAHVHLRDLASARSALKRGVTTARSLGVDHFADLGIRDLHRAGAADVPDIVGAGYHVRRRLADAVFLDLPQLQPLMDGVSGPDDIREMVRAMAGKGVDVIKVMTTERAGLVDTDFQRRVLNDAEIFAAVGAANEAELPVAAHAHTDEAANAAVRAGVRSIEHGTLVGAATLALMRQRDVCFVPTLSFWRDMSESGGEYDHAVLAERAAEMFPRARRAAAEAVALGITVAAGSDMRYDTTSRLTLVDEIEELTGSGIEPMMAIKAATSEAARCIGVGNRTGAITVGFEADLIVVDGDPLIELDNLRRIVLIVNDGRVTLDKVRSR